MEFDTLMIVVSHSIVECRNVLIHWVLWRVRMLMGCARGLCRNAVNSFVYCIHIFDCFFNFSTPFDTIHIFFIMLS